MDARSETSKCLWGLIAVVSTISIVIWGVTGVGLEAAQLAGVLAVTAGLMGGSTFYTVCRPDPRLARLFLSMAELLLLCVMIGALSYCGTSLARPLWDETFQAWDEALGFDWRFWLGVLNSNPAAHNVLAIAYQSMLPQTVAVLIMLAAVGAYVRLNVFLLAYGLAALATVSIATIMPALSPVVHLGITPADHPDIALAISLDFQEHALALREGRMTLIDLEGAQGLVTFPSFHTVSAVLLLLAFWGVPYLRWIGLALNALMLLSIPIEGSHYLVDVIAGATLAVSAWAFACWAVRRESPWLAESQDHRSPGLSGRTLG